MSSVLIFSVKWKKWYRVPRYREGFGLFDSVHLGLWLARSWGLGLAMAGTRIANGF
jgi:hypothetical protein